jgi:hypothetical protein
MVEEFKYLRTTLTNQNCIQEEIKSRLNQAMLAIIQRRILKIRIHKNIILPVYLYGCETRSLTLKQERRLRVFENRVLRRIFGPKQGSGEIHIMRSLMICTPHPIFFGL